MIEIFNLDKLLYWFDSNKKKYPWGEEKSPYPVWISEIMLQQTVAASVIPYFQRWMTDYPDLQTLASSELNEVLSHWEGLGYYSRCRNIHKAATYLVEKHNAKLPETYGELKNVPGIGDYTARAILSIAFKKPYAVLDANVRRIIQRLRAQSDWTADDDRQTVKKLESIIPADRPGDFNEAMMQFGQMICTTGTPRCVTCPLRKGCLAHKKGVSREIPLRKKRKVKHMEKTVLLICSSGKILLRKKKKGLFQDMWMLPDEDAESCKAMEKLLNDLSGMKRTLLKKRNHFYTDNKDSLTPCLIISETIDLSCITPSDDEIFEYRWIDISQVDNYPSPSVYRKILDEAKITLKPSQKGSK